MKLDLHTHIFEATNYRQATPEIVRQVLDEIKAKGLDGIAVTEHWDRVYGEKFKQIADTQFKGEAVIIPGREILAGVREQVVELFLPGGAIFRFWAHPMQWYDRLEEDLGLVHGVEIDNALHNWHIDKERVRDFAEKRGLLMLSDSDAHDVKNIGAGRNEVTVEELIARARGEWPRQGHASL